MMGVALPSNDQQCEDSVTRQFGQKVAQFFQKVAQKFAQGIFD